MIPVSSEKQYHGFDYTRVCRGTRSCVYRQTLRGKTVCFEVFLIIPQPETIINNVVYPARERWPKDEDFGKTAWSFSTEAQAIEKFNRIEAILSNNASKGL